MSKIDIDKLVASVYKHEVQKLPSGGQWSTTLWTLDEVLREQGLKYKAGEIVEIEPKLSNLEQNGKNSKPANSFQISKDLQESEDEKIRKELILFVKGNIQDEESEQRKDYLAWLEKQKEQNQPNWEEELRKCKKNPLYFINKYVSVQQKEQEWSEEDDEFLRRAINAAKGAYPMTADWLKSLKQRITKGE